MGLINRLIGSELPKVSVHGFPKAYDMFERARIELETLVDAYLLSDLDEPIALVVPGTDKLGMSVGHQWVDGDAVQLRTTDTAPSPIDTQTIYFIAASNPAEGTVKLAEQEDGTTIINITDEGIGIHTLYRVDADLVFWGKQRRGIDSTAGNADAKLRRRVWDEMAEGIFELAEESVAYVDEQSAKDELAHSADYLDAS